MSEKNRKIILDTLRKHDRNLYIDDHMPKRIEKMYRSVFSKAVRELPSFFFETLPMMREVEQVKDGGPVPNMVLTWGGITYPVGGFALSHPNPPYLMIERGLKGQPKRYISNFYTSDNGLPVRLHGWRGKLDTRYHEQVKHELMMGLFDNL